MTDAAPPRFCSHCGTPLGGRYCSQCGRNSIERTVKPRGEGWSSLLGDFVPETAADRAGVVALSLLRHPVKTATELSEDPSYNGHWKILVAGMGLYVTIFEIGAPRLLMAFHQSAKVTDAAGFLAEKIVIGVSILITTPILYYLCRMFSPRARTPREYFKFSVIGVGYWFFLWTFLLSAFVALAVIVGVLAALLGPPGLSPYLNSAGNQAGALVYETSAIWVMVAFNRVFWSLKWPEMSLITAIYVLGSQGVLWPRLVDLASRLRLEEFLRQFGF